MILQGLPDRASAWFDRLRNKPDAARPVSGMWNTIDELYQLTNDGTMTIASGGSISVGIYGSYIVSAGGSLAIATGGGLDDQGTVVVSSSTLAINGGNFTVEPEGQLNLSSDSTFAVSAGGSYLMQGSLTVDGGAIVTQVTGASSTVDGLLYYSFDLARQYFNAEPILLSSWTIDWGDGSTPDVYPVTNTTPTVIATHLYSANYDQDTNPPTVVISAMTAGHGNIMPLKLTLPPTLVAGDPPPPVDLAATQSVAGEVDLSWNYDTNLATTFTVTALDFDDDPVSTQTVDANTFAAAVSGLTPDQTYTFVVVANEPLGDGTLDTSMPAAVNSVAPSGTTLYTAGPTFISELGTGTLSLVHGTSSTITSWTIAWTDQDGVSIGTGPDVVTAAVGIEPYPTPPTGSTGLIATVTATDTAGSTFALPTVYVEVVPATPTITSITAISPNEIDLSWTSNSALATQNQIMFSVDGGTTYNYFDTVDTSVTHYQAKGLTPNTPYKFEIIATNDDDLESVPSLAASATTLADPWNVQATGPSTVAEGGTYQLSLSTTPTTSAPAFDHFTVDWGDGTVNSLSSHTFASGTAFSIVQVTASTANGSATPLIVTAAPISVDVIPTAPSAPVATMFSSTEVDLTWTTTSQIASGFNILRSDGGGGFNLIDSVDAGTLSYNDTSLSPSDTVSYEVQAIGFPSTAASSSAASNSVTTPTGIPTFSAIAGAVGLNSAILTYSYQGSDDSGFEVEIKDTSIGENYHTQSLPTAVNSGANVSFTVVYLYPGDTYSFRMRVDRTDGSVSDYVDGGSVTVPIVPNGGTLTPPTITAVASASSSYPDSGFEVTLTSGYNLTNVGSYRLTAILHRTDGSFGAIQGNTLYWDRTGDVSPNVYGAYLVCPLTPGASYTLQVSIDEPSSYPYLYSPPSSAFTFTAPGTLIAAPVLSASTPDASGNVVVTWTPPAAVYRTDLYRFVGHTRTLLTSVDSSAGGGTLSYNVPGGTGISNVTAVYEFGSEGTTANSNLIVVIGPPVPPTGAIASWGVSNKGVFLHWLDNSDDETGFVIWRSTGGTGFDPLTAVKAGTTSADISTFVDPSVNITTPIFYRIYSLIGSMLSSTSADVTSAVVKDDWQVTEVSVTVKGGGDDFVAEGSTTKLKGNHIGKVISKDWFDNFPDKVKKTLKDAAKDFTGMSVDTIKKIAVGDADLLVTGLSDSLTVTGTVVIRSKKHGIVEMKVTATVVFDEVTSSPQPWLLPSDLPKIRDAAVALVQKTSERDPKGMEGALKQGLIDEAIEEDAQNK